MQDELEDNDAEDRFQSDSAEMKGEKLIEIALTYFVTQSLVSNDALRPGNLPIRRLTQWEFMALLWHSVAERSSHTTPPQETNHGNLLCRVASLASAYQSILHIVILSNQLLGEPYSYPPPSQLFHGAQYDPSSRF